MEKLTPDDVRSRYRLARPKLEAIWESPARYSFQHITKRWDIPHEMAGKVRPESALRIEVYGQKGRWRIDRIVTLENGSTSSNVVVSTKDKQFNANKSPENQVYTIRNTEGQSRLFEESQRNIAGLCEVAFVLPTRVDVGDILFSPNYKITVVPTDATQTPEGTKPVTIEFERSPKSNPSEKITRLLFETGRITFLPDRDWAIDHYTLHANTGLHMEGRVQYQQVPGMDSRVAPKRVDLSSTESKSSLKTSDVLEAVAIIPGPIDDREFSLGELQPEALKVKQTEGWNITAVLIGAGVLLIAVAIIVRVLASRRSRSPNHRGMHGREDG